jgi:hypothetical protein
MSSKCSLLGEERCYTDAIICDPIALTILKCLRFKFQILSIPWEWFGIGSEGNEFILH